jgi:hypothetical protein
MAEIVLEFTLRCEIGDGSLLKVNRDILFDTWIGLLPEILCKLDQINILNRRATFSIYIKPVCQVLNPHKYLVPLNWMHPISQLINLAFILISLQLNE